MQSLFKKNLHFASLKLLIDQLELSSLQNLVKLESQLMQNPNLIALKKEAAQFDT